MNMSAGPFSDLAAQVRKKRTEQTQAEWRQEQEAVEALRPISQDLKSLVERVQRIAGCRQVWARLYNALDLAERRIAACNRRREAEIEARAILEQRGNNGPPQPR